MQQSNDSAAAIKQLQSYNQKFQSLLTQQHHHTVHTTNDNIILPGGSVAGPMGAGNKKPPSRTGSSVTRSTGSKKIKSIGKTSSQTAAGQNQNLQPKGSQQQALTHGNQRLAQIYNQHTGQMTGQNNEQLAVPQQQQVPRDPRVMDYNATTGRDAKLINGDSAVKCQDVTASKTSIQNGHSRDVTKVSTFDVSASNNAPRIPSGISRQDRIQNQSANSLSQVNGNKNGNEGGIHLPALKKVSKATVSANVDTLNQPASLKRNTSKQIEPVAAQSNKFVSQQRYEGLIKQQNRSGFPSNQYQSKPNAERASRAQANHEKAVMLTDQEKTTFGNRCPTGYTKLKILGKGGIAVVWLGKRADQFFAMKQFPKQKGGICDSSAFIELQVQQIILRNSDRSEQQHLCMLADSVDDKKDLWLIYELCPGRTMNEHLFDVKGEFFKGERIYMVHHGPFYHALRNNMSLLREFISRVCDALNLLAKLSIVHADLKPDNIIMDYDAENEQITSLKLIDLGSSFLLNPEGHIIKNQQEFAASTPEYLPPEIQSFLARRFTQQTNIRLEDFADISFIFDMWSLGSILIEVLSGFPLWLSLKSRVQTLEGRSIINYGLFGVAGRDNAKILHKQQQLMGNSGFKGLIESLRKGFAYGGQQWMTSKLFVDLFQQILCVKPDQRISPEEILEHPFITNAIYQEEE